MLNKIRRLQYMNKCGLEVKNIEVIEMTDKEVEALPEI
jgi:hypothetical protein